MPLPGSSERFESHVDRLIREATERGDFDDLPGTGRPIPGTGTKDDEMWWVRRWLKRNLSADKPDPQTQDPRSSS